ncbi:UDP-glycosyltransferase UGT5-like [Zophobas morio]|uniref:UDP-glycosyltransferase UGT5-like n=1 Tax=Zophobas morio TaxID=2755281 RepID=UPI003082AC25
MMPFVLLLLSTPILCSNILGVFIFPSISHQIVFQPIWKELSLRGHNVTVVTPDPLNDPSLTNLTEISVRFTYDFLKQTKIQEVYSKDSNVFQRLIPAYRFIDYIVEAELNSSRFKQLIADQSNHFDLVLVEGLHPAMYALAGRFKAPAIGITSFGLLGANYNTLGNPSHPILYPDILFGFHNVEKSLWSKIETVVWSLLSWYHHHYMLYLPRSQDIAERYFGEGVSYVGDTEARQSMLFVNVNPVVYPPKPNVPAIVEMDKMHIKPVKSLPDDLQKLLDDAVEGVIYFSLGSNVKSTNLDEKLRNTILGALSELPYKVLWKWESDYLPGKPKNVVTRKWFPQQDLLAHRNIRVFLTQGGLQSIEEAVSRGVPLIGIPFMADQPANVHKIIDTGIGLGVDPVTMSKEELKNCIIEVAENSKYKKRIEELRDLLYDKPMTGLEKVVWWTEYVIRHKGAIQLRSPGADFSWFDYLLLQVVLVVTVIISTIIYLLYKLCQTGIYVP